MIKSGAFIYRYRTWKLINASPMSRPMSLHTYAAEEMAPLVGNG